MGRESLKDLRGQAYIFHYQAKPETPATVEALVFVPRYGKRDLVVGNATPAGDLIEATIRSQNAYFRFIGEDHYKVEGWPENVSEMSGDEFYSAGPFNISSPDHFNLLKDAILGREFDLQKLYRDYGLQPSARSLGRPSGKVRLGSEVSR